MVGKPVFGAIHEHRLSDSFDGGVPLASDDARRLPREIQVRHKFTLGQDADLAVPEIVTVRAPGLLNCDLDTISIGPMNRHWILHNPVESAALQNVLVATSLRFGQCVNSALHAKSK